MDVGIDKGGNKTYDHPCNEVESDVVGEKTTRSGARGGPDTGGYKKDRLGN